MGLMSVSEGLCSWTNRTHQVFLTLHALVLLMKVWLKSGFAALGVTAADVNLDSFLFFLLWSPLGMPTAAASAR